MNNKIKSLLQTIKFRFKRFKRTKKLSSILAISIIVAALSVKTSSIFNEKRQNLGETNFIAHISSDSKIESTVTGQDNSQNIATQEKEEKEKSNSLRIRNLFYKIYKFIVNNSRLTVVFESSGTIYVNPRVEDGVIKSRSSNRIIKSRLTIAEKSSSRLKKKLKKFECARCKPKLICVSWKTCWPKNALY